MSGLDGRDYAKGVKTCLVSAIDDLSVLDAVAVVVLLALLDVCGSSAGSAACMQGRVEGVDCPAVGEIADGVDVDLVAGGVPGSGKGGEGAGVDQGGAAR